MFVEHEQLFLWRCVYAVNKLSRTLQLNSFVASKVEVLGSKQFSHTDTHTETEIDTGILLCAKGFIFRERF